jgi:hypothetical protein
MIEDLNLNLHNKENQLSDLKSTISVSDIEIDDLAKNLKNEKNEREKLRKLQVSKMEFEMQQTREIEELNLQLDRLKNEYSSNLERLQSDHTFQ